MKLSECFRLLMILYGMLVSIMCVLGMGEFDGLLPMVPKKLSSLLALELI